MDKSLALALRHLRTRPGIHTHSGRDGHDNDTHDETSTDVSTGELECPKEPVCNESPNLFYKNRHNGLNCLNVLCKLTLTFLSL